VVIPWVMTDQVFINADNCSKGLKTEPESAPAIKKLQVILTRVCDSGSRSCVYFLDSLDLAFEKKKQKEEKKKKKRN
jgi:hypothetical protein